MNTLKIAIGLAALAAIAVAVGRRIYLNRFQWELVEKQPDGTWKATGYGPMNRREAKELLAHYTSRVDAESFDLRKVSK